LTIYFHAEEIDFQLKEKKEVSDWICRVIEIENREIGEINIIFSSDTFLLEINNQYLDRNYFTDIITFDYGDGKIITGDLYLSIDRIRENAESFNVPVRNELFRIIIHGILHLIGYNDSNVEEKKLMTEREDQYMEIFSTEKLTGNEGNK